MEVARNAEAREAAGHRVLHLEVGQPATSAPATVLDAAQSALRTSRLGYTQALGVPELREAIARWYKTSQDITVPVDQIIVTTGASGSCVLAFLTLWDAGARVGVLEPGYPCYRNDLEAFGIDAVPIPVGPNTDFRPTLAGLQAAGPLDGLIVASPSNPTGTVLRDADQEMILGWARQCGASVVVDEIYHGITYGDPASSVLTRLPLYSGALSGDIAEAPTVLVFNSFSKYFSMTGWRLGWIVAPTSLMTPLERLAQNLTIAPPTLSQLAGVAAFDGIEECEANLSRYRQSREVLRTGLQRAGITRIAPPDGGFYLWCDISHLLTTETPTSQTLCARWLEEIDVAVTPGIDFDPTNGDRFVRFSYAGEPSVMSEASDRLRLWIDEESDPNHDV